ncbi:hypothetical protein TNCV_2286831 [Trichonephila clavipes]|nr:hypothetical protein TNCV_2286831 [Trichonephila clavipes]
MTILANYTNNSSSGQPQFPVSYALNWHPYASPLAELAERWTELNPRLPQVSGFEPGPGNGGAHRPSEERLGKTLSNGYSIVLFKPFERVFPRRSTEGRWAPPLL